MSSEISSVSQTINSAASIFLFGYPGNGKTSIAERITRLMGDDIYIPYAVEANSDNGSRTVEVATDPTAPRTITARADNGAIRIHEV